MCEWDDFGARESFVRARLADPDGELLPPFQLLSEPGVTAAEQRLCSEIWMRKRIAAAAEDRARLDFRFPDAPTAKIRLGYLSNDFHDHATALLLIEMIEAQDHSNFELFAYSYGEDDGKSMRQRLRQAFDRFRNIGPLSDVGAAQLIHADGVQILIDLKGFTQATRTSILALRPAPLQVNYLGYPGTLGDGLCDYILTDSFVTPRASAADYAESFAYLPHSYQPRGRHGAISAAPTRAEIGLPDAGFVFCCFNQAFKFTPAVFDVWCRLLGAVPESVLWLLASREAEGNLRNEARSRGIDGARLIFAPDMAQAAHLGRLQRADLVLDSTPYGAHTSASDALWAGTPVVTCPGATFPSRVAGSLLHAVGMPELVVEDENDYFEFAFALATQPARLAALREKLAQNRASAPLFDVAAYTLALEALFQLMWRRHRAGLPHAALDLSSVATRIGG